MTDLCYNQITLLGTPAEMTEVTKRLNSNECPIDVTWGETCVTKDGRHMTTVWGTTNYTQLYKEELMEVLRDTQVEAYNLYNDIDNGLFGKYATHDKECIVGDFNDKFGPSIFDYLNNLMGFKAITVSDNHPRTRLNS